MKRVFWLWFLLIGWLTFLYPEEPLRIVSVFPFDGQKDVAEQTSVDAIFSKDLDPASVNIFSFILQDDQSKIAGKVFYNAEEKKAVFVPNYPLDYGKTYTAIINTLVQSRDGTHFKAEKRWIFTVRNADFIHPTVVSSYPRPDAKNVSVTANISVLFSEQLSPDSVNNHSIVVTDPKGSKVPGKVRFEAGSNKIEFIVDGKLAYNTLYTVKVDKYISDLAGNILLQDVIFSFTTQSPPDKDPPQIIKLFPYDGAEFAEINKPLEVYFNEPLDEGSIDAFSIQLKKKVDESLVSGKISYNEKLNLLSFKPDLPLEYNTEYEATLKKGIKDKAGNAILNDMTWNFKTKVEPDTTPPRIVSTIPQDLEEDVNVDTTIQITFSEQVAPVSLNEFTVKLMDGPISVKCKRVYDEEKKTLYLTPDQSLAYNTLYTLKVRGAGVRDLAGNQMDKDYKIEFKTSPPPDKTAPKVVEVLPHAGSVGIRADATVELVFSEKLDPKCVKSDNIYLETKKGKIKAKLNYYPEQKKIEVIPEIRLPYKERINVVVKNISDLEGNLMSSAFKTYFITQDPPDTTPPEIVNFIPKKNADFVPIDTKIVVQFSEPILKKSINEITIKLWDGKKLVPVKFGYETTTNKLYIIPQKPLLYSHRYQVKISRGIQDLAFNRLKKDYLWSFKTISEGPQIVYSLPKDGESNVDVTNNILLIFDKPLKPETINPFSCKLFLEGKYPQKLDFNYDKETRRLTVIPKNRLQFGKRYELVLYPAIKDIMGRPLVKEYHLKFTTMKKAVLAGMNVAEGYTYVETNPFKTISRRHWAFDVIKKLVRKGYLKHYPFFNFDGNKNYSRYEMGMMVAKILREAEQRSKLTRFEMLMIQKLVYEFSKELQVIGIKIDDFETRIRRINLDIANLKTDMESVKEDIKYISETLQEKIKQQKQNLLLMLGMMIL